MRSEVLYSKINWYKMLHFVLLVSLILSINAHPLENDPYTEIKIIGGNKVNITNYPHNVAVIQLEKLWCGGSIISPNFVLTAKHCVIYATSPLSIHAGTSFWARPGSVHRVQYNVTYGSQKSNDVALLRVIEAFVFDATRRSIPLFSNGEVVKPGTMAIVSGWGLTSDGNLSDQLVAVQVPIIDQQSCNTTYSGIISEGEICAGITGKDSCTYDSGGPLVVDGRQAGIVSMGSGCGKPIYPGIYANVAFYSDWIAKQLAKNLLLIQHL